MAICTTSSASGNYRAALIGKQQPARKQSTRLFGLPSGARNGRLWTRGAELVDCLFRDAMAGVMASRVSRAINARAS